MPRYAVLLRGINVGTAKRVAMADLRALLTDLGYDAVRTVLKSGNAVVTGPEADPVVQGARVEAALATRTGVPARCLVLDAADLHRIVADHPFAAEMAATEKGGSRMMAHLLFADLTVPDLDEFDPGQVQAGERVIYQWCLDGLSASPDLHLWATRQLGIEVTTRNWNTVAKLAELL